MHESRKQWTRKKDRTFSAFKQTSLPRTEHIVLLCCSTFPLSPDRLRRSIHFAQRLSLLVYRILFFRQKLISWPIVNVLLML